MKSFDYYKFKDELNKTYEKLCVEQGWVIQKRYDLESGKANLYHDTESMIKTLKIEESRIQKLLNHIDEMITELEWFTCE